MRKIVLLAIVALSIGVVVCLPDHRQATNHGGVQMAGGFNFNIFMQAVGRQQSQSMGRGGTRETIDLGDTGALEDSLGNALIEEDEDEEVEANG